ncbi:MAG: ATP-binding cassette domain-containing protein [Firmicutes bacterium]|nr:ATP-binding cassette domain-containing protein [Bacillota bacterium]
MLRLDKIQKSYGKAHILKGASLDINKGDCIAIIGGNGCGKTTLVQVLCGIIRADRGSVLNGAKPVEKGDFKYLLGYLPQNDPLIDELSVKDNLKLWFSAMDVKFKDHPLIKKLKIDAYLTKTVNKLSGGMKRRVSLCIAMANEAPILVLDEPTTALDIVAKDEMWSMLGDYISSGGTVVFTTHNYDELKNCTRLMLMKNGVLKEINKNAAYNEIVEYLYQGERNE